MLESDILMGDDIWSGPFTVTSADDEGFDIPKQTLTVKDPNWGHEVERVGH